MNKRKVDKTKKSNIKCEHCLYADKDNKLGYWCVLQEKPKNYYNRCKLFKWNT